MNKSYSKSALYGRTCLGSTGYYQYECISVRLHWTDKPYKWHINDGEEVFAVMDGTVEMRYKEDGQEKTVLLHTGDIFYAGIGTEHVAHPQGEGAHISHRERRQHLTY